MSEEEQNTFDADILSPEIFIRVESDIHIDIDDLGFLKEDNRFKEFCRNEMDEQKQLIKVPNKQFECSVCHKFLSRLDHLKRHEMSHTGIRPFSCDQCEKTYYRLEHLKRHQSSHLDEKPFQCLECNKCFTRLDHLKRHKRLHALSTIPNYNVKNSQ